MKTTEKIAFAAMGAGVAAAAGLYWLASGDGPWWVYAGVAAVVAGIAYAEWVKQAANEHLADKD